MMAHKTLDGTRKICNIYNRQKKSIIKNAVSILKQRATNRYKMVTNKINCVDITNTINCKFSFQTLQYSLNRRRPIKFQCGASRELMSGRLRGDWMRVARWMRLGK